MNTTAKPAHAPRWWDFLAALLLCAALLTASTRLVATHWTTDLDLAQYAAFAGIIAGLALGQSIFSRRVTFAIGLVYTLFIIPWLVGLRMGHGPDWPARLLGIGFRLRVVVEQILSKKAVSDNIFFIVLMVSLFWILSIYAGFTLTRYGYAWRIVLPAGLSMLIIQSYDPLLAQRAWYLAAYLLFALLLMARLNYIQQRKRWKENRTYIPPDIGLDWIRFTLGVVIILVMLAWTVPVLAKAMPAANDLWQQYGRLPLQRMENRVSNVFSSLHPSVGVTSDYYGKSLVLGTGNYLSDDIVFTVRTPHIAIDGLRLYWSARVYDQYTGGQWLSNYPRSQPIYPSGFDQFNIKVSNISGHPQADIYIDPLNNIATLFTAGEPIGANLPVSIQLADNSDGTVDISTIQAITPVRAGQEYGVKISLNNVTQLQLRQAGINYPSWVTDRYLEVPDSITPRMKELATEIAAGKNNPYDIAQAVTDYLRANMQYQQTIPAPPAGQEPLDWFLFDYKKGYCNYYASSEVMLLRSLGIPARMVAGYAQGEHQTINVRPDASIEERQQNILPETYTVRQRDAHAWPEVYFPGIGWVEFEPTASQSALVRPSGNTNANEQVGPEQQYLPHGPAATPSAPNASNNLTKRQNTIKMIIIYGSSTLVVAGLGFLLFFWRKRQAKRPAGTPFPVRLERGIRRLGLRPPEFIRRWARFASLSQLSKAYLEINRALGRLGKPPAIKDTPAERGAALNQLLPAVADQTEYLVREYQLSTYSLRPADTATARQAGGEIRKHSYLALLKMLFSRNPER